MNMSCPFCFCLFAFAFCFYFCKMPRLPLAQWLKSAEKVNILVIFTTFHSWWMPELTLSQPNLNQDIILKNTLYSKPTWHLWRFTMMKWIIGNPRISRELAEEARLPCGLYGKRGLESELEKRQIGGTRALETETWAWTTGCRKQRDVWGEAMRRRRAEYQRLWAERESSKLDDWTSLKISEV